MLLQGNRSGSQLTTIDFGIYILVELGFHKLILLLIKFQTGKIRELRLASIVRQNHPGIGILINTGHIQMCLGAVHYTGLVILDLHAHIAVFYQLVHMPLHITGSPFRTDLFANFPGIGIARCIRSHSTSPIGQDSQRVIKSHAICAFFKADLQLINIVVVIISLILETTHRQYG